MTLYSFYYTAAAPAAPGLTIPEPYLHFATAGPNKSTLATSGSAVTSVTVSTGQLLLPVNTVGTVAAPELGAGVVALRCGYYGYIELQTLLPAGFYGAGSRSLFFLYRAPVGISREVATLNPSVYSVEGYDFCSLDNPSHTGIGCGIHLISNDAQPALPAATEFVWRPMLLRYDSTANGQGAGMELGVQYIQDHQLSNSRPYGQLKTGQTTKAKPRIGLGSEILGGGGMLDIADVRWWPAFLRDEQAIMLLQQVANQYNTIYSV
ncbi:hypothetical protein [Hymenobacter chitinivorans]|uniref:Uncharacterized protein n=1 Tax=Hymenobacter chitinivorans DSM 11115 TaxID=1121954 RepID=A0A2M9BNB7_9BACT|nr:hypothetical protein [Hymenobacter chitinivorans]PJJ59426.1 hypothetical protein CLV45_0843 [Hymenobacter chitinivorans DSM 11115]